MRVERKVFNFIQHYDQDDFRFPDHEKIESVESVTFLGIDWDEVNQEPIKAKFPIPFKLCRENHQSYLEFDFVRPEALIEITYTVIILEVFHIHIKKNFNKSLPK